MRGKSFASTPDNIPTLPVHDVEIAPDVVTTLFINADWRRLISDALQTYADSMIAYMPDADVDDFRNGFQALLNDLYTVELMSGFSVFSTTTSASLAADGLRTIPLGAANDPANLMTLASNQITILESGWYSVNLILSVRNAATASSTKQVYLINITTNATLVIGVPTLMGASAIVRAWNAMNDIFEVSAGDVLEFQIYGVGSASIIESDGTIAGRPSRCLQALFEKLS